MAPHDRQPGALFRLFRIRGSPPAIWFVRGRVLSQPCVTCTLDLTSLPQRRSMGSLVHVFNICATRRLQTEPDQRSFAALFDCVRAAVAALEASRSQPTKTLLLPAAAVPMRPGADGGHGGGGQQPPDNPLQTTASEQQRGQYAHGSDSQSATSNGGGGGGIAGVLLRSLTAEQDGVYSPEYHRRLQQRQVSLGFQSVLTSAAGIAFQDSAL